MLLRSRMASGPLTPTYVIVASVLSLEPRSVVDLGMGTGKYGFLLREQFDLAANRIGRDDWRLRIVGVEGWADYVGDHSRAVYDEIVIADARDYLRGCEPGQFDIALAIDILEHFPPVPAVSFLDSALETSRYVLVSTPRRYYPQEEHGNELERHLSWWPPKALRRVALNLGAQIAVHRDRLAIVAMLSRHEKPALVTERGLRLRNTIRSALIPETVYCRLRGRAGPTI